MPIREALKDLEAFIEKSLAEILEIRGDHVHLTRFTDKDLDRLETLDFVSLHAVKPESESAIFRGYYLQEYRKIRRKWRATIRGTNVAINKLLEFVSDVFLSTVFSAPDHALRAPANL